MYWLIWLVIMIAIPLVAGIVVWRGQAAMPATALGSSGAAERQGAAPSAPSGEE